MQQLIGEYRSVESGIDARCPQYAENVKSSNAGQIVS